MDGAIWPSFGPWFCCGKRTDGPSDADPMSSAGGFRPFASSVTPAGPDRECVWAPGAEGVRRWHDIRVGTNTPELVCVWFASPGTVASADSTPPWKTHRFTEQRFVITPGVMTDVASDGDEAFR